MLAIGDIDLSLGDYSDISKNRCLVTSSRIYTPFISFDISLSRTRLYITILEPAAN